MNDVNEEVRIVVGPSRFRFRGGMIGKPDYFNPEWSDQAIRNWTTRWVGGSKLRTEGTPTCFDPTAIWSGDRTKFVRVDSPCPKCEAIMDSHGRCPDLDCDFGTVKVRAKDSRKVIPARHDRVCDECGGRIVTVESEFGPQAKACAACGLVH